MLVRIDATSIRDWNSFHAVFKQAMGFPDFYGANMDAWIDCMSYLDDPAAGMTAQHVHGPTQRAFAPAFRPRRTPLARQSAANRFALTTHFTKNAQSGNSPSVCSDSNMFFK
jgi:hypothetical protein